MLGVSSSPYKDTTNHIGLGPHPTTFLKFLSPNMITLGVRASTYEFGKVGKEFEFEFIFRMSMTQVGVLSYMPSRDVIHSQLLYIYNIKI